MAQLSEKEVTVLQDLLSDEEQLVKKFQMLSQLSEDPQVKEKYQNISRQHQGHFNALYGYLQ